MRIRTDPAGALIFVNDEEFYEKTAEFLGFKAKIEVTRMFAKQLLIPDYWTGTSTRALVAGRETYDRMLDENSNDPVKLGMPLDLIVTDMATGECAFLVPHGVLYADQNAITAELDAEIILKDETMQLNVWLKFIADPVLGRYVEGL